jgi:2-polyprenyl-3-methyl-5-hydroxy-6-metoxy-1,4-benzoquinol methylase
MAIEAELPEYYRTVRSDILQFLPSEFNRVLEIGCSGGGFSEKLLRNGAEVWGVEPNTAAAEVAGKKLTRVINSTFEEAEDQLPKGYFDLIVCNDVIEHMPDHDRFLQAIKAMMKERAVLVGSLPNIRHITALVKLLAFKDFPYRDEGILDRTHLRFFTRKSIERSLRQNGYEVEALRGVNNIITEGICRGTMLQNLFWRVFTSAVVVVTLGYYADVVFPQFAFRASLLSR